MAKATGFGSSTKLPTCAVVPSDLTWNTAIPACVAFEHTLLELKITGGPLTIEHLDRLRQYLDLVQASLQE